MTTDTTVFMESGSSVQVSLDEPQCKLSIDFCSTQDGSPGSGRPVCGISIIATNPHDLGTLADALELASELRLAEAIQAKEDRQ